MTTTFTFKGLTTKFVAVAKAFKSAILTAAEKAPAIATDIDKDAPELEALTELAFPGAVAVEQLGFEALEVILDTIEAAGPAALANGLSVTFDKALLAKAQAAAASIKAFAAKL